MTLSECNNKYDLRLCLDSNNRWYWIISGGGNYIKSDNGYVNPNETRSELVEFLKDFKEL